MSSGLPLAELAADLPGAAAAAAAAGIAMPSLPFSPSSMANAMLMGHQVAQADAAALLQQQQNMAGGGGVPRMMPPPGVTPVVKPEDHAPGEGAGGWVGWKVGVD
jgi:hypothetical protein